MKEPVQSNQRRDPDRDLLLVVDMQEVYLPGNPWACPNIVPAVAHTAELLRAPGLPETILTRFVPPPHPQGRWRQYNEETRQVNASPHLAQLAAPIRTAARGRRVVEKSTYSAVKCPAVRRAMAGKRAMVLAGVVAECCVLATMLDAIDLGWEVICLSDCIAGQSAELEELVRRLAERFSPVHTQLMRSGDYLSSLL